MEASGTWSGEAPAKVNLRLRVLAREESGYHQIETVFQALELADRVELEVRGDDRVTLDVVGVAPGELGPDEENLVVRAARRFQVAVAEEGERRGGGADLPRVVPGVDRLGLGIRLEKRVPHGAGLGGGSSDAAAVLRGLNELFGAPLSEERLLRLAGELGADVPFFLLGVSRALGWGRGDRLLPLPSLPRRPVLVVVPAEGISTQWAYGVLARRRAEEGRGPVGAARLKPDGGGDALRAARSAGEADGGWAAVVRDAENDFEEAIFPGRPGLQALRDALREVGAAPALLSGSGSALFGVFESEGARDRAAEELPGRVASQGGEAEELRLMRTWTVEDGATRG